MTLPKRQATPNSSFSYVASDGKLRRMVADEDGVVTPSDLEDVRVLDAFGLPVAARKTAKRKATSEAQEASGG